MFDLSHQLHAILCKNNLINNNTIWLPQSGGRTNKVWRLKGDLDLICKLYQKNIKNPLFNNMPSLEYHCLLSFEHFDLSPKPYKLLKTYN